MKKTIFITGVGKRIGLALAQYYLAKGMNVIGTYRSHYPSLDELTEGGASLYQCDLSDPLAIDDLIALLLQNHQRLDTLIHNASDWLSDKQADLSPSDVMARMMQIHVSAPYQLNLGLAPLLTQTAKLVKTGKENTLATEAIGASNIIHITDYVAEKGSKKHIAYAASKAALHNMSLSFAAKLAPEIKVNSIAPAMILFNEGDDAAYQAKTLAKAILPKEAGSQEIIDLVEYLHASHYVTGRSFAVDGGRHLV
jgi:dihydromonapterin reductase/dihydrofolate reductase